MKKTLTFLGSGAARYIGLGLIPRAGVLNNVEAADLAKIEFNFASRSQATASEGILSTVSGGAWTAAALTVGTGVIPYVGGDTITAEAVTHLVPVDFAPDYAGDMRRYGTLGAVTQWTLDTAGSYTGHLNVGINTTYVNVGSVIIIRDSQGVDHVAHIVALTNDGDAANEITLDRDIQTGVVQFIGYMYDLVSAPVGTVMPAGIYLAETAALNVAAETCSLTYEFGE